MESDLEISDLITVKNPVSTDTQKAWHLVTLLLTLGRPTHIPSLASHCTVFTATSSVIESLCNIPNSPLLLTTNRFVTVSFSALIAVNDLVSGSSFVFGSNFGVERFGLGRLWWGCGEMWGRKRRRSKPEFEFGSGEKKRVRFACSDGEEDGALVSSLSRDQIARDKVCFPKTNHVNKCISARPSDNPMMPFHYENHIKLTAKSPLPVNPNAGLSHYELQNITCIEGEMETIAYNCEKMAETSFSNIIESSETMPQPLTVEEMIARLFFDPEPTFQTSLPSFPVLNEEVEIDGIDLGIMDFHEAIYFPEKEQLKNDLPLEAGIHNFSCMATNIKLDEIEIDLKGREEIPTIESSMPEVKKGSLFYPYVSVHTDMPPEKDIERLDIVNEDMIPNIKLDESEIDLKGREEIPTIESSMPEVKMGSLFYPNVSVHKNMPPEKDVERLDIVNEDMIPTFERETSEHLGNQITYPSAEVSVAQEKFQKASPDKKTVNKNVLTSGQQPFCESSEVSKLGKTHKEQQKPKKDHMPIFAKQDIKQSSKKDVYIKVKGENMAVNPPKDHLEPKVLPHFESFIVEEEEGSGGYGTVYRVLRKSDRQMFAVKCPHANAHRDHVTNELKMLERFGGKNFIIKYEGSFKSEKSDCFVLEHVDHDRPEVLKKEIDVVQLQWYGYCMFRALASLHKQGVVHRDVKPGNFLFSCKINKGYLIDFNLAMDLHQKYGTTNKSKAGTVPLPHTKPVLSTRTRKLMDTNISEAARVKAARSPKATLQKTLETKVYNDLSSRNSIPSQGADGSGITSAKDLTSTRSPSTERLREPMCWLGTRKELNNLAQEACQIPRHETVSVPVSGRKRVAAPPVKTDREVVYLTPMPLHNNKGDKKLKREGPCCGTKGFRAPEVLFRSPYQGPKMDVWSAGVTLLYLMIGRVPFVGEPDQNIKDIAKLRGSEDLWEVAKLHGRESSFPEDLLDFQSLPSMKLREWSEVNTKKPNLLQMFPRSLFDLVDKCLTVNPRVRISAEEALKHEFFRPCQEAWKKQSRQGQGSHAGNNSLSQGKNG